MSKLKNIFNLHNLLSKKEVTSYLNKDLNETDLKITEKKIMGDDFNHDAIDGYETVKNGINKFENVQEKINNRIHSSTSFWNSKYTLLSFSILVISVITLIFYKIDSTKPISNEKLISESDSTQNSNLKTHALPITELSDKEIDNAPLLPIEERVLSSEVIISSPITIEENTNLKSSFVEIELQELLEIKQKEAKKIKNSISIENSLIKVNSFVKYLQELLIVDYSKIRTSKIKHSVFELSGIPASSENLHSPKPENDLINVKSVDYDEFLLNAMIDFRKNRFKSALKKYKIILQQYPDDINGLFYGALCYFNINQFSNAIDHFDGCINHFYNTFDEEANWYKGLSLYEQNELNSCIEALNNIISKKGFYTEKAENLLGKIKGVNQ